MNNPSRTVAPAYAVTHGPLTLTAAPRPGLLGLRLTEAGALGPGDYECAIALDGCNIIEVDLMCSALTGSVDAYLRIMRWNRASWRASGSEDSGALVAATPDILTLSDIRGRTIAKVMFTVGAGESVTFDAGTDPTTPTALAEFNCL